MLTPRQQALKRASRALIEAVGGFEAAANYCRLSKTQLHDCCNPDREDRWLPVDVVAALEAITVGLPGAPHVTALLARERGLALFVRPDIAAAGADPLGHLRALLKEGGDVQQHLAALAAGGMSAASVAATGIVKELDELIAAALSARADAIAVAEGTR